jgi:septum formation protein
VITADVRELNAETASHLNPSALAMENARLKAQAVAASARGAGHWVLGADTVVALDGKLYGKPESPEEAREFLRALSGRTHEVITGCALIDPERREQLFHATTRVTFRALSDEIIARYLAAVHVLDKAGAYALQEHGDWIIERVDGSRSNVIGLPCELLAEKLASAALL